MSSGNKILKISIIIIIASIISSCANKKGVVYSANKIPSNAKVAVIIDSPNNIKNAVLVTFLKKGFKLKGLASSDLYTMRDVFDIKDLKKVTYQLEEKSISSIDKAYDNVYKLHIYNFELNKVESLKQIRTEWDVEYLILIDVKNWESVSWVRVINLKNYDIEFVENYPTDYNDTIETITEHFIKNIIGK